MCLQVASLQHSINQQVTVDKQMERSLKVLLQDAEDVAPGLQIIARTWDTFKLSDDDSRKTQDLFPRNASKQDYEVVTSDEPKADMPCNCDPGLWQRFRRWYSTKAHSSNSIFHMQAEMADLKVMLETAARECERCAWFWYIGVRTKNDLAMLLACGSCLQSQNGISCWTTFKHAGCQNMAENASMRAMHFNKPQTKICRICLYPCT